MAGRLDAISHARILRALDEYSREYAAARAGHVSPTLRRARADLVLVLEQAGEELPGQVRSQVAEDVAFLVDLTQPTDWWGAQDARRT